MSQAKHSFPPPEPPSWAMFGGSPIPLDQRPALPVEDILALMNLPAVTLYDLWSKGQGPRRFKIGRRVYVTPRALREWVDELERAA